MKRMLIGCAGLLLCSGLGARAQEVAFELAPFYGYRFGGSVDSSAGGTLDLKAGQAYGLALDFGPRDSGVKFEVLWSRQESGIDLEGLGGLGNVDVTVNEFMLGGVYEMRQGHFRERIAGIIGATVFNADGNDAQAHFCLGLDVGVKYFLLKNLALCADLRGYFTLFREEASFISSGGNMVAYFGGSALWQGEVTAGFTLTF
jgi:hypothetical protein